MDRYINQPVIAPTLNSLPQVNSEVRKADNLIIDFNDALNRRATRWRRQEVHQQELDAAGITAKEARAAAKRKLKNAKLILKATHVLNRLAKEKEAVHVRQAGRAQQAHFNARVEAVFKKLDSDQSGELSMEEMERTFGEETRDFFNSMDGEIGYGCGEPCRKCSVYLSSTDVAPSITSHSHTSDERPTYQIMRRRVIMTA